MQKTGMKVEEILLVYATKQLSEDSNARTLAHYNIKNLSTLHMVGRLRGGSAKPNLLELRIYLENGEELKVEIESSKSVNDLKSLIYKKSQNLSECSMSLFFGSVALDDGSAFLNTL